MPKLDKLNRILVIGSGPVIVGQTGELDQASSQACDTLRTMGTQLIITHSDPAAVATDSPQTDSVYIEPLDINTLSQIIAKEKPDAVLPIVGGQTALNLAAQLSAQKILKKHQTTLLGISPSALNVAVNRTHFKQLPLPQGIEHSRHTLISSASEAIAYAEKNGYPLMIRAILPNPGKRNAIVFNVEELQEAMKNLLLNQQNEKVILEEALLDYREIEVVMVRDKEKSTLIWATLENLDPVGIHHGDSVSTIPSQSISEDLIERLENTSRAIAQSIEMVGLLSLRFAYHADTRRLLLLNITPRASRSSSLASLSTGIPIHRIATLIATGMNLREMPFWSPSNSPMNRLPVLNTVVKFPKWAFDRFHEAPNHLDIHMQAVGEVVGMGDNFKCAFQKALRALTLQGSIFEKIAAMEFDNHHGRPSISVLQSSSRYWRILAGLRSGESLEALAKATQIDLFFLNELKELVEFEKTLRDRREKEINTDLFIKAKSYGFSNSDLAAFSGCRENEIEAMGQKLSNASDMTAKPINSFSAASPPLKQKEFQRSYLIVGPGPIELGLGLDYDHSSIQASRAVTDAGHKVVRVNCNPASSTLRNDTHETVYVEPLNLETLTTIYAKEAAQGILLQFSGPFASQAHALFQAGLQITGMDQHAYEILDSKIRFHEMLKSLGIAQPDFELAHTYQELLEAAERIDYPVMIRSTSRSSGPNQYRPLIVMDAQMMKSHYGSEKNAELPEAVIVERFIEFAIECEVDALCDGLEVFIPTVLEHIELAGVNSADSACVTPPYSTPLRHIDTMNEYTRKIIQRLNLRGVLNIRFAIYNDTVYVLDATPWANRTLPLTSKICNLPMAYLATRILLGASLSDLSIKRPLLSYFGVKEAVFPFTSFPHVDPLLGPQIYSTGSVMALADSFGLSYYKSQEAIRMPLPLKGAVLITVTDADKPSILEPARLFKEMGFSIKATKGTQTFLENYGIAAEPIRKLGFGRPNLVDAIKTGEIDLVINTPSGKQSKIDDADIRKAAIQCHIPNITTPAGALAAAKGIAARLKKQSQPKTLNEYHISIK